jgi:Tfp pilus assembly protein PilX
MIFLVLFTTLALGFYSQVTTSVQVAYNDRDINQARAAAESGMQFARFQLNQLNIPHNTPVSTMMNVVFSQLSSQLNGTANLAGDVVGISGTTIRIPSQSSNWIATDGSGSKFQIIIKQNGQQMVVETIGQGRSTAVLRAIQMTYAVAQRAGGIFNYGIASKGALTFGSNLSVSGATDPTKGSILAASAASTPFKNLGNASISGDLSWTNAAASLQYGNLTVDGYAPSSGNFSAHTHAGITSPEFPTIDTSCFIPYATNIYTPSMGDNLTNCVLPPGNYQFGNSGTTTIKGVLYIMTPCSVTFQNALNIQGCIVVENNPKGDITKNLLSFTGQVTAQGIDTLPANATFPAAERALTGSFILAPTFKVSVSSNFGTVNGSIIASQIVSNSNFSATVKGSIIVLDDNPVSLLSDTNVSIASVGTTQFPAGVFFDTYYVPLADTYLEVLP